MLDPVHSTVPWAKQVLKGFTGTLASQKCTVYAWHPMWSHTVTVSMDPAGYKDSMWWMYDEVCDVVKVFTVKSLKSNAGLAAITSMQVWCFPFTLTDLPSSSVDPAVCSCLFGDSVRHMINKWTRWLCSRLTCMYMSCFHLFFLAISNNLSPTLLNLAPGVFLQT